MIKDCLFILANNEVIRQCFNLDFFLHLFGIYAMLTKFDAGFKEVPTLRFYFLNRAFTIFRNKNALQIDFIKSLWPNNHRYSIMP